MTNSYNVESTALNGYRMFASMHAYSEDGGAVSSAGGGTISVCDPGLDLVGGTPLV